MFDHRTERDDAAAHRKRRRRRAALLLGSLLGSLVLVLVSTFALGVFWGSSRNGLWLLQKEQDWLGWDVPASAMAQAEFVDKARRGEVSDRPELSAQGGEPSSDKAPQGAAQPPTKVAVQEAAGAKPIPVPRLEPGPPKQVAVQEAAEPKPSPVPRLEPGPPKQAPPKQAPTQQDSPASTLPTLDSSKLDLSKLVESKLDVSKLASAKASKHANPKPPGSSSAAPAQTSARKDAALDKAHHPSKVRARFELPAKISVMLVVDAQAFPDPKSCQRARSALHSAGVHFQAWLNLQVEARGCLPWVGEESSAPERGRALAALDLPGTDLLLAVSRQGQIRLPSSASGSSPVFNAGLALAQVPGGSDDAAMRRAVMHALGRSLGAQPIDLASDPDAKRGSIMAAQADQRRDWLDEPNRLRMLERKSWPFRRDPAKGGQR